MKEVALKSGKHIAYKEVGTGARTLLALSGLGCDHYNFLWLERELAKKFRLIMIDNRGMGQSSDTDEEYEISHLAEDVIEFTEALGLTRFGIMGISMGGFITQELLLKIPERIERVALLCSTSGGDDFTPIPNITTEAFEKAYAMGKLGHELAVKATVHPDLLKNDPDLFNRILELRLEHAYRLDQVILQNNAAKKFLAQSKELTSVLCPVLILHGEDDRFVSPQNAQVLGEKFQNSQVQYIPQSDHLFFLEKSEQVAAELIQFFDTNWETA